ncbi:DUF1090 family protein [Vibrio lentus]|nr:DUF1090 family protein [Vibrio lentus]
MRVRSAGDLSGCERKSCEIEYQIDKAKEYGNQHKVDDGLTKALKEVKANCTELMAVTQNR